MRKEERLATPLEVKIPSFFRCPISLDVMKSPVSLCTGVTYDRASIQRWLDSGNTTCPATMQSLPSTDLVPNLTLQRLIRLWCSSSASDDTATQISGRRRAGDLLREIPNSDDPAAPLRKLAGFFSDDDVDEFEKNDLVTSGGCASAVLSAMRRRDDMETLEAAVRVLAIVLESESVEDAGKKIVVSEIVSDLQASVSALVLVLTDANELESRINAARVLQSEMPASDSDRKSLIADSPGLISGLIRLIGPENEKGTLDRRAVLTGITCLAGIATGARRSRAEMVRLGAVPAVTKVLEKVSDAAAAEAALRVMEAAASCAEGRAAMCEDGAPAVRAVAGRMLKAGKGGAEAAVAALWSVCCKYKDRRAAEAVAAADGGLTRLLLVMQSGCSPAARMMAGDLIKLFKVNAKSCLAGYDSKTSHIMPF